MVAAIRIDIANEAAECETCPAHNEDMARLRAVGGLLIHGVATAIYRLTIGAGFRQPSYLCPDCLNKLRAVLGVSSGIARCDCRTRHECHCQGNKEVNA